VLTTDVSVARMGVGSGRIPWNLRHGEVRIGGIWAIISDRIIDVQRDAWRQYILTGGVFEQLLDEIYGNNQRRLLTKSQRIIL